MAKRLIDTELWNNEDIIENFTAKDKYFWLYLLTSPHNNICGVCKYSPAVMARDMGLHKDTIINLLYRFETYHKAIYVDKEMGEILILNWYKHNWTKSPKILTLVQNCAMEVKSAKIRELLEERIVATETGDTVAIGYQYPTISIPNSTPTSTSQSNSYKSEIIEIIDYLNKKAGKGYRYDTNDTIRHITARLNEGFTVDDFKKVIDNKVAQWGKDPKMAEYLRPSTLFGTKFESYLNAQAQQTAKGTWDDLLAGTVVGDD